MSAFLKRRHVAALKSRAITPSLRSEAARAALGADHDVCPALAAASHTNRVFEALHSIRSLQRPPVWKVDLRSSKELVLLPTNTISNRARLARGCLNGHPPDCLHSAARLTSRRAYGEAKRSVNRGFPVH